MKIPIADCSLIDLDARVLPAYEVILDGEAKWIVWCKHCRQWHCHGSAEGHREAHCRDSSSPYWERGYNLAYAGKWEDRQTIEFQVV
jgi:hypothetical protein